MILFIVELFTNVKCFGFYIKPLSKDTISLLSLRVFRILSSSLLLFPQRFGRYVLQPSSGVCRTREPIQNFKLCLLLNPQESPVLISLAITGYKC